MFKFIDREEEQYIVLVSGWAFDYRVFATLDLPYNYIFFCGDSAVGFEDELKKMLDKNGINKVSLLGWSQGAFMACDFASRNPGIVEEIILAGTREKYEKAGLANIKRYLVKNRTAYLYKFYKECFCDQEKNYYRWFKDTLLKNYLEEMSLEQLVEGLDWIEQAEINSDSLKRLKHIKIVHGCADSIAPIEEAVDLSDSLPQSQLITFDKTGHLPFLQKDFKQRLYED